jgi:hypothetical protein
MALIDNVIVDRQQILDIFEISQEELEAALKAHNK